MAESHSFQVKTRTWSPYGFTPKAKQPRLSWSYVLFGPQNGGAFLLEFIFNIENWKFSCEKSRWPFFFFLEVGAQGPVSPHSARPRHLLQSPRFSLVHLPSRFYRNQSHDTYFTQAAILRHLVRLFKQFLIWVTHIKYVWHLFPSSWK